jgi:hypothetical protein
MSYTLPSLTPSGTTFSQFQQGGLSAILEKLVTVNSGPTHAPTAAPTATATGGGSSGGFLAAGTYLLKFTETNGIGETTASPESATLTVAAGDIPQVTFPTLQTGNVARNLYATPVNGTTGTEVQYATGITTTTFNMSIAAPSNSFAVAPPTINTTGLTYVDTNGNVQNLTLQNIRAAKDGNLQPVYNEAARSLGDWNHGDPVTSRGIAQSLRHSGVAFAFIAQAFAEAGTLVDANSGTIAPIMTGTTTSSTQRTWP